MALSSLRYRSLAPVIAEVKRFVVLRSQMAKRIAARQRQLFGIEPHPSFVACGGHSFRIRPDSLTELFKLPKDDFLGAEWEKVLQRNVNDMDTGETSFQDSFDAVDAIL